MLNLRNTGPSTQTGRWLLVLTMVILTTLLIIIDKKDKSNRQKVMENFFAVTQEQIIAFKIRPDSSSSYNDSKVVLFDSNERLVADFLQAITDSLSYQPKHDTTSVQWGIQIKTKTTIITMWFYIPSAEPESVVGNIESKNSIARFQSQQLYDWYQKYRHRWLEPEEEHDTKEEQWNE